MTPVELSHVLADCAAQHGLVRLSGSTDEFTVTVSERSMWEPPRPIKAPLYGFDVEVRQHDL